MHHKGPNAGSGRLLTQYITVVKARVGFQIEHKLEKRLIFVIQ